jgi:hypothetical protein
LFLTNRATSLQCSLRSVPREGTGQAFGTVRIQLAIETRSQDHIDAILDSLDGYQIGI